MDVKFYDLILLTEQLKRDFNYLSKILPIDFSEILNMFENTANLTFQLILGATSSNFHVKNHEIDRLLLDTIL